jgi:hypothetical protein
MGQEKTRVLLARSVGYQNAKQRAFIVDGAAWLRKLQAAFFTTGGPKTATGFQLHPVRRQ